MTLQGKRVLITGAAGGLGTAATKALRKQGARVVGIDRVSSGDDPNNQIIVADVKDSEAVKTAVAQAIQILGGLDILINNAGVLSLQDAGAPPDENVAESLETNLLGAWRVTAAALPALLESRGRVINVASLFAIVNAPFIPGYSASKRALSAYSDVLRFQYKDRISVTTVYPGYMNTPIHNGAVRQGLSVAKVVTFGVAGRTIFSLEESLDAAARGLVRACAGRPARNRGLTPLGTLTVILARHVPSLVDWFVGWRIGRLIRTGALKVQIE